MLQKAVYSGWTYCIWAHAFGGQEKTNPSIAYRCLLLPRSAGCHLQQGGETGGPTHLLPVLTLNWEPWCPALSPQNPVDLIWPDCSGQSQFLCQVADETQGQLWQTWGASALGCAHSQSESGDKLLLCLITADLCSVGWVINVVLEAGGPSSITAGSGTSYLNPPSGAPTSAAAFLLFHLAMAGEVVFLHSCP